jgi:hypothetical protein
MRLLLCIFGFHDWVMHYRDKRPDFASCKHCRMARRVIDLVPMHNIHRDCYMSGDCSESLPE